MWIHIICIYTARWAKFTYRTDSSFPSVSPPANQDTDPWSRSWNTGRDNSAGLSSEGLPTCHLSGAKLCHNNHPPHPPTLPKWQNSGKKKESRCKSLAAECLGAQPGAARHASSCARTHVWASVSVTECLFGPHIATELVRQKVLWLCPWPESICHLSFWKQAHDSCVGPAHAPSGHLNSPSLSCGCY